jgi:hypothetical protein
MPSEVLAQKSHKWVQMQNKRYGEKRKAGFIDTGKQVNKIITKINTCSYCVGSSPGARPKNHQGPW